MTLELHPKESVINAALMTKRPVAFLVGSPLSLQDGFGVPGITKMLDLVRDEIRDRASFALPQFESALNGKTGAEGYQVAMKWLGVNAGQDAVNEVIAKAVLQARKPTAGECPAGTDGQPEDWNIPAGTTGLAELVTRGGDRFLGPILTTNFDPLLSLGIRKAGGRAGRRVLSADGNLAGAAEDEPGVFSVIHLHGFWRDSDTLHTQAQLTNFRPKLKASLQRLLVAQRRTLIVAAYGGWDDVFTQALVELVNDEQAQLDVIWCFYESDPGEVTQRYGKLLQAMNSAILLNRFRPFGGIDCHTIFTEILSTLQSSSSPAVVSSSVSSPLAGWENIDLAYLNSLPDLSADEVVRYFDGAVPSWPHAISSAIPKRQVVWDLSDSLTKLANNDDVARSLHLIRAAGGEGKSTLLLQATANVVRSGRWTVLSRVSSTASVSPEQLANLNPEFRWLIVADDADTIVADLATSARQLSQSLRRGIHFLLAARDVDWKSAGGSRMPWAEWLTNFPDTVLRGVSSEDANAIVAAWEQFGSDGLRALSDITDTAQRVAALESAVSHASDKLNRQERHQLQDGSFFGGLLAVRFGQNGLQAHVRDFLQRLKNVYIEHSINSLFDALLYVAACHGVGIPGIDERVLADLVGVPREWVQRQVVRPLGEEATAIQSARHVLTRHSQVAAAILVEVESTFGVDLAEVWAQLVKGTVRTSRSGGVSYKTHSKILHAGTRLQHALPHGIPKERRKAIAIAAARADYEAQPERLGSVIGFAQTLRLTGDAAAGADLFRHHFSKASSLEDASERIRGYWYTWSVCEGEKGITDEHAFANAWLGGISLSDYLSGANITEDDVKLGCAGLGVAFGKLSKSLSDRPYAKARRAVTFLGRRFEHGVAVRFFDRYDREADELGTPHPLNVFEAIAWLTAGVAQAGRELKDPLLKSLLRPEDVSYTMLERALYAPSAPENSLPRHNAATITSPANDLLKRLIPREDPVQVGIERVIAETWTAIPVDTEPGMRFHRAVRQAKRSIASLSPHIRRSVGAYFETRKWEPLKTRDPNGNKTSTNG